MQCPVDGTPLVMADRSGVEIDYCPKCRGVWLDRGELDKIIERAAPPAPPVPPVAYAEPPRGDLHRGEAPRADRRRDDDDRDRPRRRDDDDDRRYRSPDDDHYYKRKKRGSFLDDLFDF